MNLLSKISNWCCAKRQNSQQIDQLKESLADCLTEIDALKLNLHNHECAIYDLKKTIDNNYQDLSFQIDSIEELANDAGCSDLCDEVESVRSDMVDIESKLDKLESDISDIILTGNG